MKPLVEPGPQLTTTELVRSSRQMVLPGVGERGQRRLAAARVLVIGAGGLGSPALTYLAAAGVGTLGVLDSDRVELSNLARQVIHSPADLGRPKTDSAADRIAALNPEVRVRTHPVHLDAANALEILGQYDLVLDGTDNFPTRYLINDACALLGIPEVWGSIFRFDGQVSVFWAQHGPTYRDLFPTPPAPGTVPSCAEGGVFGTLCASIGAAMATEAVKLICGLGDPLIGRLLVFDALAADWRQVRIRPRPGAAPITELVDYEEFCGMPAAEGPTGAAEGPVGAERFAPGDEIDVRTLRQLLADRDDGTRDFVLVDVREEYERRIVAIPGSVAIPLAALVAGDGREQLPLDLPLVLYCKSGVRSAQALAVLKAAGVRDVVHVAGGVLAWIRTIDPLLPTY